MMLKASSRMPFIALAMLCAIWLVTITVPYIYAAYAGGPTQVFGGFLLNPTDGNSYLAKMYQGWLGDWRFRLPYTAKPGQGAYLFTFYLFLGHLARWTGTSLIMMFHIARLFSGLVLFFSLYIRLVLPLNDNRWPVWVFLQLLFGSGLGWLVFPLGVFTSDFWVAEAYPFLSAYTNPHFTLGLAVLLWIIPVGENSLDDIPTWLVVALSLLLAIMSPFGVVLALAILGGMVVWEFWSSISLQRRSNPQSRLDFQAVLTPGVEDLTRRFIWILLGGGLVVLYQVVVTLIDPVLAGWNSQNVTPSPPFWDLFLSLSPVLLLAVPGARIALRGNDARGRTLLVWAILGLIWLYLPFNLQRRLMMGLYVPFVVLSSFNLSWLSQLHLRRARMLAVIVLILSLPTNMLVLLAARHGIQTRDPFLYLSVSEAEGMAWIRANTPQYSLVLASSETSLFIPAHTGRRVLAGHPFETVNAEAEEAAVSAFFADQNMTAEADFLIQRGVAYVFYGPRERAIGRPQVLDALQLMYSQGDVEIFQVINNGG